MAGLQNSINAPTPFAIAKGGTGNTAALTNGQLWVGNTGNVPTPATLTGANGIAITNGAGAITVGQATTLTNGQLWVGNTGNVPTAATITAGTNIGITNAAGAITVNAAGPASWTTTSTSSTSVTMSRYIIYVSTSLSTVTFNLPNLGGTVGDQYKIIGTKGSSYSIILVGGPVANSLVYSSNIGSRLTTTSSTAGITLICTTAGSGPTYAVLSTNGEVFALT